MPSEGNSTVGNVCWGLFERNEFIHAQKKNTKTNNIVIIEKSPQIETNKVRMKDLRDFNGVLT